MLADDPTIPPSLRGRAPRDVAAIVLLRGYTAELADVIERAFPRPRRTRGTSVRVLVRDLERSRQQYFHSLFPAISAVRRAAHWAAARALDDWATQRVKREYGYAVRRHGPLRRPRGFSPGVYDLAIGQARFALR